MCINKKDENNTKHVSVLYAFNLLLYVGTLYAYNYVYVGTLNAYNYVYVGTLNAYNYLSVGTLNAYNYVYMLVPLMLILYCCWYP